MSKQIIMTSPTSFGVNYVINPWMENNTGAVNFTEAMSQWSELRNVLTSVGVDVIVTPRPPSDCPDAVFTANAGLIYKDTFIPSYFKNLERAGEEPYFINWMKHYFDNIANHPTGTREQVSFEGAGDALFEKNGRPNLWLGFGFRTELGAKTWLDGLFADTDVIIRPVQLVDPRFYHLDTCFCPLDTGELLWYPQAFDEHSQYVIRGMFDGRMIEVGEDDACAFACNAVSVRNCLILPKISTRLARKLHGREYHVFEVDMSEFMKSGGACKCLTLEVIQ